MILISLLQKHVRYVLAHPIPTIQPNRFITVGSVYGCMALEDASFDGYIHEAAFYFFSAVILVLAWKFLVYLGWWPFGKHE